MTRNFRWHLGLPLLVALLMAPGVGLAAEPEAADAAVVVGEEIEATGKISAINRDSRLVVIDGSAGNEVFLRVPQDAPNFDQIEVGDEVVARYQQALAIAITPATDAVPGVSGVAAVSSAPPGATPGAVVAEQVQLRAVVQSVDVKARTVTLEVPRGGTRTLKVQEAVDLARVKVGEQVSVTHTHALAISLVPKP